jgi:hypothetical protein
MGLFSENGFQNFRQWFSENAFGNFKQYFSENAFGGNTFRKWLLGVMLNCIGFVYCLKKTLYG